MDIRVGTSGWNYPTGPGTWNGVFYPKPRPKGFDELTFYAQFFRFVEVNSTFYGQPRTEVTRAWAERTPGAFEFAVKLYQQFTHPKMFRERIAASLQKKLDDPDIPASVVDELVRTHQADLDAFKAGIEPLAAAGKLGPLLAQFPASFKNAPESRAHVAMLLRAFHGYLVCVELRHASWNTREAEAQLRAFGAPWVEIDEPKFKDSVRTPTVWSEAPFRYLRLHGRNAEAWWHHADRDDRYNYLYSVDELTPIAEDVGARPEKTYVAFNNHPNARSVANALTFQHLVGELVHAEPPEKVAEMVRQVSRLERAP